MKKYYTLLLRVLESLGVLATGAVFLVLFFMWFPDFIVWYSGKMASIKMPFLLDVIPLYLMVAGLVAFTMMVLISAFHLRKPEIQEEIKCSSR